MNDQTSGKSLFPMGNIVRVGFPWNDANASSIFTPMVIQALMSNLGSKVLHDIHVSGLLTKPLQDLLDYLKGKGGKLAIACEEDGEYTYIWDDTFVAVCFTKKEALISIGGKTCDAELAKISDELKRDFISEAKNNLVFTIVKEGDTMKLHNMGKASSELIRDNYQPQVIEDIEHVIKSFKKTPPSGRICILNGEPGTGKTYLVRAILTQMDCIFIIVPSNMLSDMDKPDFLPLLLQAKQSNNKPIVLIIEDGDVCLVPRKNDNISSVVSLLNLSDGIIGSMVDIKVIISTNANIKDIDEAIMRPGRLCRNIHVDALPYAQATKVYQRLMNDETARLDRRGEHTLAEIYALVNNVEGEQTIKNPKRVIGFSQPTTEVSEDRILNKATIGFGQ